MLFFCLLVFTVIVFTAYASNSSTDILSMQTAQSESSNWYSVNCTVDTEKHKHLSHLVLHDEQDKNVFVTKSFVDYHCNVSSVLAECTQSRYNSLKTLAIVIHVPDNVTRCFNCTAHFYKTSSWQSDTQICVTGHSSKTEHTCAESSDRDYDVVLGFLVTFIIVCVLEGVIIFIFLFRGKTTKAKKDGNSSDEDNQDANDAVSDEQGHLSMNRAIRHYMASDLPYAVGSISQPMLQAASRRRTNPVGYLVPEMPQAPVWRHTDPPQVRPPLPPISGTLGANQYQPESVGDHESAENMVDAAASEEYSYPPLSVANASVFDGTSTAYLSTPGNLIQNSLSGGGTTDSIENCSIVSFP